MSKFNSALHNVFIKRLLIILIILFTISSLGLSSQEDRRNRRNIQKQNKKIEQFLDDSIPAISDSLQAVLDSTHIADSLFNVDSLAMLKKSSLEAPAFTTAKDSIIEDFSSERKVVYYYGEVSVNYGKMKLTADYMEYDINNQTLYARGTKNDSTGIITGMPVMEDGGKSYEMEEVKYNFKSQKARITNMVTQEQDGILHGKNMKMMPDQSINITHGKYTVCDCPEPHYYLHLTAAKVMMKPSQKTVFGPAYPVVEGVPFPVVLPFGFIPKKPDRATGILMPTFGEEAARGFYLRDMGMYFVIGDYFDISLTGDYYTLGSWAVNLNSRYKINYIANGSVGITYSNDQTGEKGSTDFFKSTNFAVKWSHSQDPKARPGTSFSASVNFSSPSNNKFNSTSVNEALQSAISSSISYSKNWNGKVNLSVNALHSQNSRDSSYAFTLPNVTLSVSRFYPFKRKNRIGKEKIYEKFSLGYNTSLQNKINFKAKEFGQEGFYDKFKNGMTHSFQIGLPNFSLLKYINVTPNISYGMNWFFTSSEKVYNEESQKVEKIEGGQFSTLGATHTYSGGLSMSTRVYGLFNFGKHRKLQALRHVVSPSLSVSLSPDKATHFNGWRTLNYIDSKGEAQSQDYNIYEGQLNSVPGKGKTASMSLSIGNNLEAKVRDLSDTTGTGSKKIKLIDQLSINTGYNFLADSLNMSNVGMSMSTSIFGKVGVSANMNLDPYGINERGQRISKYSLITSNGKEPLRLTNASASLSYSFSGEGKTRGDTGNSGTADDYTRIYYHPVTGEYIPGGWLYYANLNAPWSVNFNYSYNYRKAYEYANENLNTVHNHTQTLGISGNIKLTPKMSINMSSGFDIMAMRMTTTQLSATYDLHCFNIAVSWVPTGQWQQWSFRIAANAAALADLLKYKKSTSYWDR